MIVIHFFHKHASRHRNTNRIRALKNEDGIEVSDGKGMESIARSYFHKLFLTGGIGEMGHILFGIGVVISKEANR